MKRTILLIPAFALFTFATATAQTPGRTSPAERFAAVDTNGDGAISRAEMETRRLEQFAKIDANSDGALTQAEMDAAAEQRKAERETRRTERMAARFSEADTDGNGTLSIDEFEPGSGADRFDRLDTNQDGLLTKAEMETARDRPRRFGNGPSGS